MIRRKPRELESNQAFRRSERRVLPLDHLAESAELTHDLTMEWTNAIQ